MFDKSSGKGNFTSGSRWQITKFLNMRITINFSIKKSKKRKDGKAPVYVRCTMNGNRIDLSTGIFVDEHNWDNSRQQLKGKKGEVSILNNKLGKVRSRIYDVYNQLEAKGESFDVGVLKDCLIGGVPQKGFLKVFDLVISSIEGKLNRGYSQGTLRHYYTTRYRLGKFLVKNYQQHDVPLERVNYSFLDSFDTYLKSVYHITPNTAWGYHRHLKKVLNDAVSMGYLQQNPYESYKVKRVDSNRDYLTLEELRTIEKKEIVIGRLSLVRDIFVFACYTGLSYSDIEKLGGKHLYYGDDGEVWIIIDRTKTTSRCRIPLLPQARLILDKYSTSYNLNSLKLLPVLSNQKMNAYLKEIADICRINKNLSMHVARHTFATSVTLANGVPIETVSSLLGHKAIRTTQIYARILDSKISDDMKELETKLFGKKS